MRCLLDMPPCFPPYDLGHRCGRDASNLRYLFQTNAITSHFSYCPHKIVRQFSETLTLAEGTISPAFAEHISHVVCIRPREKMIRIAARRVVTFVQNVEAVRYWSNREFPRHSMGKFKMRVFVDPTVTACDAGFRPRPTGFRSRRPINAVPKPFLERREVKSPKSFHAGIVGPAKRLPARFVMAAISRAFTDECGGCYGGVSHCEVPSRWGQERRTVSSGRRFAFMTCRLLQYQPICGRSVA